MDWLVSRHTSPLGAVESPLVFTTIFAVILWSGWYLWRFYVAPTLYPNEPRLLPYWIPYLGHTFSFLRRAEDVYLRAEKYFANTDEPYSVVLMGGVSVIIRNIKDLSIVWRNTTALSYDPFTSRMLMAFGITPRHVRNLYEPDPARLLNDEKTREQSLLYRANPKKLSYMHLQSQWFKTQLLPGDHLKGLLQVYPVYLSRFLQIPQLRRGMSSETQGDETKASSVTVPLGRFCRYVLAQSAFRTFFGEELFEVEPQFAHIYQRWEDASWKVFYNIPPLLAPGLHSDRKRTIAALAVYLDLPDSQRKNTAWIFGAMNSELTNLGLPASDRAGLIMMICWAINNNAHYIAFWMFAHILCDANLKTAVISEINACFPNPSATSGGSASPPTDDYQGCDMDKLVTGCPQLNALWAEALRLYNFSTAVRKAVDDCSVNHNGQTFNIRKGQQVFGPVRNFHRTDGSIFGDATTAFDHTRFLRDPKIRQAKEYFPFGGGHTLCPGRHFAEREIYLLVALTLRRFEVTVVGDHPTVPPINYDMPALAAAAPKGELFVTLRR
ncbi:cytochrome P450 [Aspergillus aculeatinus CBS 121060]|uniref:Cytochrome P450 n=1 Tax=Aspergillus aculeatinus CBS 121060 TaxID=1448322 RepID=A0ACD1H6V9_9EURO|nr:cytochrome P450 [Aspergillus aculeatinus CBS 121060]RAH69240.1 cytochrome P450 [Aspergillus aculeatinus CBS 121060]